MNEEMLEIKDDMEDGDILYEMFGVDNDEDLEYALDCWNND